MTVAATGAPRPDGSLLVGWGNVLFRLRDALFPAVLVLLVALSRPVWPGGSERADDLLDAAGLLLALAGQVLRSAVVGTVYIIRGGKDRKVYAEGLVTGGFFAHCRNPLYVGNVLILLGLFTIWNATLAWAIGVPFFLVGYAAIVAAEESFLRGKFGAEYDAYCARVPRWIPDFRGLGGSLAGMRFNWARLVVKEYGSAAYWTAGAAALLLADSLSHQPWAARPVYHAACVAAIPVVALLWGVARWLKKSGRLKED